MSLNPFRRKRTWQDYWRLEAYHHKVSAGHQGDPAWREHPTGAWTYFLRVPALFDAVAFPPLHIDGVRPEDRLPTPYYANEAAALFAGALAAIRLFEATRGLIPFCECPGLKGWHLEGAHRILSFSGSYTPSGGDDLDPWGLVRWARD